MQVDVAGSGAFESCLFVDNAATLFGGGVSTTSDDYTVIFSKCSFGGNRARFGGAGCFQKATIIKIDDSEFRSNVAEQSAGAIQLQDTAQVECTNCSFLDNEAFFDGGALEVSGIVFLKSMANFSAVGSVFDGNTAGRVGGAIHVTSATITDGSIVSLIQSNVTNNNANLGGGGVFQTGLNAQLNVMGGSIVGNVVVFPYAGFQTPPPSSVAGAGGGVHLENPNSTVFTGRARVGGNRAVVGADVFWRYENSTTTDVCVKPKCSLLGQPKANVKATQAWGASVFSSPKAGFLFQSGVAVDISSGDTPLTVEIVDFYGGRALMDFYSTCSVVSLVSTVKVQSGSLILAVAGLVDFSGVQVIGPVNSPFKVEITCIIDDGVVPARGHVRVGAMTWAIGLCACCRRRCVAVSIDSCVCVFARVRAGHAGWALNSAQTCTVCPATVCARCSQFSTLHACCCCADVLHARRGVCSVPGGRSLHAAARGRHERRPRRHQGWGAGANEHQRILARAGFEYPRVRFL